MVRSQWFIVMAANDGSTKAVKKYQTMSSTKIISRHGFVATVLLDYNTED